MENSAGYKDLASIWFSNYITKNELLLSDLEYKDFTSSQYSCFV